MTEVYFLDPPRVSYIVFQLGSILLHLVGFTEYRDIELKLATQGILLCFYPLLISAVSLRFLKKAGLSHTIPIFLTCILVYLVPVLAPSFNGSQQGFIFFFLMFAIQLCWLRQDGTVERPTLFVSLLIFSSLFYPPATVTGCGLLLVHWFSKRAQRSWLFYLILGLLIVNLGYIGSLLILQLDDIYRRSLSAIDVTWNSPLVFYFVLSLFYSFSMMWHSSFRPRFKAILAILSTLTVVVFLYQSWSREILTQQYEYRVYIYTLGFLFLLPVALQKIRYDKRIDFFCLVLALVFAVLIDFRASFLHGDSIRKIQQLAQSATKRCQAFPIERNELSITPIEIHTSAFLTNDFDTNNKIPFAKDAHRYPVSEFFKPYCQLADWPPQ